MHTTLMAIVMMLEKLGFVKTTIEYALKDPKMKDELIKFIKELGF